MARLTNRILEAIIEMAGMIEADGTDQMQGHTDDKEREKAFDACVDAGSWAAEKINKRLSNRVARLKS